MKKHYIKPQTGFIPDFELPTLLAGTTTEQSPFPDAKEADFDMESRDGDAWDNTEDNHYNPWK